MALALARSRYYEYEVRPGYWEYDGSGDLGRIQRQNVIIEAVIDKARSSSYNPLKVNAFLSSIVHDITKDNAMSTSHADLAGPALPRLLRLGAQDLDPADPGGELGRRPGSWRSSRSPRPAR